MESNRRARGGRRARLSLRFLRAPRLLHVFRLLLHLYPASFRHEYGEEMCAVFARRVRDASGPLALAGLLIATVGEVLANAAMVHADILRQDVRYVARTLRRAPGFAITAIVIVALGIGATTATFSVMDFVLIRPLPFPNADRLVKVYESKPGYLRMDLSPANYRDWTRASRSLERIGAYFGGNAVNLIGRGEPQRLATSQVSWDLFSTLGVRPLLGRLFSEPDDRDGAAGTLISSYRLWQTEFGGDPGAVGQSVLLDNEAFTIIGVMPREFNFPTRDQALWTTLRLNEGNYRDRNDNLLYSVGRLRAGVTLEQARAELKMRAEQSREQYPKENENTDASVFLLNDEVASQARLQLYALSGAAGCVLLIACANLANLLLARALERRRELAVRTAMGAGRERLVRQLMTESLLLALAGGSLGVVVAVSAVPLFARLVPTTLPIADTPSVDLRVLVFAAALTVFTGIVFGLAPVMHARGGSDTEGLREGSRAGGGRKERLRSALVVAEIVASVVLLVSAGLLTRALWAIQSRDPGFKPDGVLTLRTALPVPQYVPAPTREAFYTRVLAEVRALPGVIRASYVTAVPLTFRAGIFPVAITGEPVTRTAANTAFLRYVTPGYFGSLGIPIKRGRDVTESDADDRPSVAVVSESFVRRHFPNEDPIGRHFQFALGEHVIVGVAGDVRLRGLERASEPQVYLSYRQVKDILSYYVPIDLVVQAASPTSLVPSIRAVIRKADPRLPVSNVALLSDLVDRDTASRSAQVRVLVAFAAIAFVLAAVGIHGLLSFAVSQRAQEIGVRMALGAQPRDILGMVVKRSVWLAIAGVVPGIALAYAAGRSMQALLVGVTPGDAPTFVAVGILAVVMTIIGSLMPTLRALRVDPITAIRTE